MKKIIAIPAALVLLGLAACGTAAPAAQAPVAASAMTTPAPVETPATTVAPIPTPAPAPAPAPVETVAPTTAAPPPAPAPVEVEVNIQNEGIDVIVPEGPVVMAPAPQVIVTPAPPPVNVAPPAPVHVDESLISPGTIEDGVHHGYLTSAGRMWSSFTFDRADLAQDGTWSNTSSKLRTMPIVEGAPTPYFEPGLPIEVHVQNQHVVAIYAAYPIYPMVALDDGTGDCTC